MNDKSVVLQLEFGEKWHLALGVYMQFALFGFAEIYCGKIVVAGKCHVSADDGKQS